MKSRTCTFRNTYFKSVSLIITTYNQEQHLQMVLDSVLNLACSPSEVLVADDGGGGLKPSWRATSPFLPKKICP
ncbi:hypothetical protein NHP190003_08950 [Helicobacter sp. NHP19-003]|uniref:Glycosyltransferase 2-like domain-containing protein n=1 Tax=Helicobacter gastrocanis TaxID=2849641 RepID=A0ABN6I225_9HELI|nr:hypothetical protein NHP190003_08950 [Helicobacter sp. NHP19-003]